MCGRYALGVRMNFVRRRLQQDGMAVDEAPEDDDVRETYNFAPGNIGAVYRADASGYDAKPQYEAADTAPEKGQTVQENEPSVRYKIQGMKWGLIPFWTKRQPDYGSLMRTINCRDDSLIDDRGMWTSMKRKKRCIVICQGYYEWLKRGPGGKERIPYFTRRKDGNLMYLAGLWDCVSYEGKLNIVFRYGIKNIDSVGETKGSEEKLYTYTVITTSASPSLKFLHDRMPVILDPNSKAMKAWLDPHRTTWSKELQANLKPYEGDLECYQVPKEVGKVGNNSPDFIVPVSSKENKSNIVNFFANAKKKAEPGVDTGADQGLTTELGDVKPASGMKRQHPKAPLTAKEEDTKKQKIETSPPSPQEGHISIQGKMRSATHNQKPLKRADNKKTTSGTPRITNFFSK